MSNLKLKTPTILFTSAIRITNMSLSLDNNNRLIVTKTSKISNRNNRLIKNRRILKSLNSLKGKRGILINRNSGIRRRKVIITMKKSLCKVNKAISRDLDRLVLKKRFSNKICLALNRFSKGIKLNKT